MFSSVGIQWRIAIGLAAMIGLGACDTAKTVELGPKEKSAGRVIVTSDAGLKYGVTVVSDPKLVTRLDGYSFTDSPPSLVAGDEFLTVTVRLTNADGSGPEPVPYNVQGLGNIPFRVGIPNEAYESIAKNHVWTNSWAFCQTGLHCWGNLSVASTDPAWTDLDFVANQPQIEAGGITIVMYVVVPPEFDKVLDQVQLFWFRPETGTQTTIPLS